MKRLRSVLLSAALCCLTASIAVAQVPGATSSPAAADEANVVTAIRANADKIAESFNGGKAEEIAAYFLPTGELIDEAGTVYQGQQEIKNVLLELFKQFPATKLTLNIDSIRLAGPVAVEEGTRVMTSPDGAAKSHFRYLAIWAKADKSWKIASYREIADEPAPTPHDYLRPLEWLLGDWVNEGADGRVAISYRWSEDKNYLLGEFKMTSGANASRTSSQRIGWDANGGRIRSWLFDADGGFSEGTWTVLEDSVVIKSTSTNPDGSTASATLKLVSKSQDSFELSGTERIVGGNRESDFTLVVTRRSPAASN